jgi:hypothetical protein
MEKSSYYQDYLKFLEENLNVGNPNEISPFSYLVSESNPVDQLEKLSEISLSRENSNSEPQIQALENQNARIKQMIYYLITKRENYELIHKIFDFSKCITKKCHINEFSLRIFSLRTF